MQDLGTRYEEVVSLTDTIVNRLNRFIANIKPLNVQVQNETAAYLDTLTKPPGSLGKLESLAIQLAALQEYETVVHQKSVVVMAGDHGVCEEGISAFPAEVTPQMVMNFLNGGAAVNVLARQAGQTFIVWTSGSRSS